MTTLMAHQTFETLSSKTPLPNGNKRLTRSIRVCLEKSQGIHNIRKVLKTAKATAANLNMFLVRLQSKKNR